MDREEGPVIINTPVVSIPSSTSDGAPIVASRRRQSVVEWHGPSEHFQPPIDRKDDMEGLSCVHAITLRLIRWLDSWNVQLYPADQDNLEECDDLLKINPGIFEACYFIPDWHPRHTGRLLGGLLAVRLVDRAVERGRMWDVMERLPSYREPGQDQDKLSVYEVSFIEDDDDDDPESGIPEMRSLENQEEFVKNNKGALDLLWLSLDPYTHTPKATKRRAKKKKPIVVSSASEAPKTDL